MIHRDLNGTESSHNFKRVVSVIMLNLSFTVCKVVTYLLESVSLSAICCLKAMVTGGKQPHSIVTVALKFTHYVKHTKQTRFTLNNRCSYQSQLETDFTVESYASA